MRWTRLLTSTLFVLIVAAVPAQADDDDRRRSFRGMDRNGDGVITRREWSGSNASFRNHDFNRDGVLSGREIGFTTRARADRFARPGTLNREQYFRMLDRNRDGVLTHSEYDDHRNRPFEWVDQNRDGVLSWHEWRASREAGRSGDPWWRGDQFRVDDRRFDDRRFNDFMRDDRNRDEFLTRDEWRGTEWSFHHHDRDDDGRVHISEYLRG